MQCLGPGSTDDLSQLVNSSKLVLETDIFFCVFKSTKTSR